MWEVSNHQCGSHGEVLGDRHDSEAGVAGDGVFGVTVCLGFVHLECTVIEDIHCSRRRGMDLFLFLSVWSCLHFVFELTTAKLSPSRVVLK